MKAVVGMGTSRQAVMTANLLSMFNIPNLGIWATSDELSDKTRFEYFLRLLPPDSLEVRSSMLCTGTCEMICIIEIIRNLFRYAGNACVKYYTVTFAFYLPGSCNGGTNGEVQVDIHQHPV